MKTKKMIEQLPAVVSFHAPLEIEAAADESAAPTFKMIAYTGGQIRVAGWDLPVVVDLQGLTIPIQRLPVRLQHDAGKGVGHTTRIEVVQHTLLAEGAISRDTLFARDVVNSAKKGFPWQVSIGANPQQVEFVDEGQKAVINGAAFDGPFYWVKKSVLNELSFVDLGADTQTSASIAAEHQNQTSTFRSKSMLTVKEMRLVAQAYEDKLDKAQLDSAIVAAAEAEDDELAFRARLDGLIAERERRIQAERLAAEIAAKENERVRAIRAEGAKLAISAETIDRCIADTSMTIEAARKVFLDEIAATRHRPNVGNAPAGIVVDKRVDLPRVLEAAAYMSCRTSSDSAAVKHYDERTLEAARAYRGIGFTDLFRLALEAEGKEAPALRSQVDSLIRASYSTTTLPYILSNLTGKVLLDGYRAAEQEWRKVARIGAVKDFKKNYRLQFATTSRFEKIGTGGELKYGTVGEQAFEVKADTWGSVISIPRQMIKDDDLNAFADLVWMMGVSANDAVCRALFTLLESNPNSFFSSANGNLPAPGSGNALSFDAFTTAEAAFLALKKPDGSPAGARPSVLLVPAALKSLAEQLMGSQQLAVTTTTGKSMPTYNIHAGKCAVAYSAYLTSSTSWYLLADPRQLPAMEVAFVDGNDQPVVESAEPAFDKLGYAIRAYIDFGVAMLDPRGAVKMATS